MQFIITAMNLKPIYSAFDRLIKGYYEDSLTLARVPYEAFLRIVFISFYPDLLAYSFDDKKKGVRYFNLTNFVEQDLRLGWNHYNILSAMAHAYKFPVLKKMVEFGNYGQRGPLTLSFERDEVLIQIGVNILKFLVFAYLRVVTGILLRPHKEDTLNTELLGQALHYIELERQSLISHPTQHWNIVAADLDHVFMMVAGAEDGKDWKSIRDALRGQS